MVPLFVLLAMAGCGTSEQRGERLEPIGLTTSLPILWRETSDLTAHLDADTPRHWALAVLAGHGTVRPLDSLSEAGGAMSLPRGGLLVMAQPRPLAPDENAALDD
jgi:hypothetical protein